MTVVLALMIGLVACALMTGMDDELPLWAVQLLGVVAAGSVWFALIAAVLW